MRQAGEEGRCAPKSRDVRAQHNNHVVVIVPLCAAHDTWLVRNGGGGSLRPLQIKNAQNLFMASGEQLLCALRAEEGQKRGGGGRGRRWRRERWARREREKGREKYTSLENQ